MRFQFKSPTPDLTIVHRNFVHDKCIKDYPRLLYYIFDAMQNEEMTSHFPRAAIRKVELMMRHLLLGGILNNDFMRKHIEMTGVLALTSIVRDATCSSRHVRYSDSIVNFMLIVVAQVTYLYEDVDAQDAIESAYGMSQYGFDFDKKGVKSSADFRKKHGCDVNISNERPRWN